MIIKKEWRQSRSSPNAPTNELTICILASLAGNVISIKHDVLSLNSLLIFELCIFDRIFLHQHLIWKVVHYQHMLIFLFSVMPPIISMPGLGSEVFCGSMAKLIMHLESKVIPKNKDTLQQSLYRYILYRDSPNSNKSAVDPDKYCMGITFVDWIINIETMRITRYYLVPKKFLLLSNEIRVFLRSHTLKLFHKNFYPSIPWVFLCIMNYSWPLPSRSKPCNKAANKAFE